MTLLLALVLFVGQVGTVEIGGTATWFDNPQGEGQAAAGPALRIGDWRGSTVRVCAQTCIVVRLTDWCACKGDRIIDLDDRDFAKLAPLSRGVVSVTVELIGDVRLPPTDTAEMWAQPWGWSR